VSAVRNIVEDVDRVPDTPKKFATHTPAHVEQVPDGQCPGLKIDVGPPQPANLTAPQPVEGQVPGMAVAAADGS
jgi:hypothetical protein